MNVQTVLVTLIFFITAVVGGCLAYWVYRKSQDASVTPFLILTIALSEWSFTYGMEIAARTLAEKVFWAQFQYLGISLIPVGWFLFAQAYSGNEKWSNSARAYFLYIIPVFTILAAFTNRWHGLFWAEYEIVYSGQLSVFHSIHYGPVWWIFFIYSYILLLWGSLVMLWAHRTRGKVYRHQFILILIALVLPWGSNALFLAHLSPIQYLDYSPLAFTISAAIFGWGMFRLRIFDLMPITGQPVLHQLAAAAVVLDIKNRVVEFNSAAKRLFSIRTEDPIGMPVEKALDWWSKLEPAQRSAIEANQDIMLYIDGMRNYFSLQITPIWNSRSKLTGRFIILRDITGDKLAGEAMALAQVKTEFLAKVSHELRSPLTSILGLAEMLDYGVYGALTEDQRGAVKMVYESAQHMTRIVNDLLQQSRLERGTFRLDVTEFSLSDLLDRLSNREKASANLKGLDFTVELAPEMPKTLRGDPLRLYQVFSNLTDNAIKYTHKGKITVRVYIVDPAHFAFEVQDTGVGIPNELQRVVFNPFQQAGVVPNQKENGFGLGLSIVKQLLSLMNGEISLASEVGVGSTFTVILPIDPAWEQKT